MPILPSMGSVEKSPLMMFAVRRPPQSIEVSTVPEKMSNKVDANSVPKSIE